VLVIFDEIHHAGNDKSWGDAIRLAFEPAQRKLMLSGTPNRTDGEQIPFIRYSDSGHWISDMKYTHEDAIIDRVVRTVSFHHDEADVFYRKDGEDLAHTIQREMSEDEAEKALGLLLRGEEFVASVICKAHEKLMEIRRDKHDAACLILCIDQSHAEWIGRLVATATGQRPAIVVSDEEKSTSTIEEFRRGRHPWIVAVRKVSEGVDIRRLMVLCYLTTTTTDLFFRQAIGRIMRNQGTDHDQESYCYIPDDPRLVRLAKEVTETQMIAIKERNEREEKERKTRDKSQSSFEFLGTSEGRDAGITVAGTLYEDADAQIIQEIATKAGVPESKAAVAVEVFKSHGIKPKHQPQPTERPEVRADRLRRECSALANKIDYALGQDKGKTHLEYVRFTGIEQKRATVVQLERKKEWLEKKLEEAKRMNRV
jgi:superfamily II DNA or RNA helicase